MALWAMFGVAGPVFGPIVASLASSSSFMSHILILRSGIGWIRRSGKGMAVADLGTPLAFGILTHLPVVLLP